MKYVIVILVLLLATLGVILFVAVPRVQQAELNAAVLNTPPASITLAKPRAGESSGGWFWPDGTKIDESNSDQGQAHQIRPGELPLYIYQHGAQIAMVTPSGSVVVSEGHTPQEVIRALARSIDEANTVKPCNHADGDNEPQNASF